MAELCLLLVACVGAHLQMGCHLTLQTHRSTWGSVGNTGDATAPAGQQEGEATEAQIRFSSSLLCIYIAFLRLVCLWFLYPAFVISQPFLQSVLVHILHYTTLRAMGKVEKQKGLSQLPRHDRTRQTFSTKIWMLIRFYYIVVFKGLMF